MNTHFDPGIDISPTRNPLGFNYGKNTFGPAVEIRHLNDIRKSLKDRNCKGPEQVYGIAMDIGKLEDLGVLKDINLLFGAVTYPAGTLGKEPIRSQGHIHIKNQRNGWSTPEVYEIWEGETIIYMQETANDDPGQCFAVYADPGDVVVVPPGWAHATISANPRTPLTFGAWCDRDYGFEYDKVKAHQGLAWYPLVDKDNTIQWYANPNYHKSKLIEKSPEKYDALNIETGIPIYTQFENDKERFLFVPEPFRKEEDWNGFIP